MKIRMLTTMAGDRMFRDVGDVVNVDRKEGKRLIELEYAESASKGDVESASVAPPRNAMKRGAQPRVRSAV